MGRNDGLLNPHEAAEKLGVTYSNFMRLARSGYILPICTKPRVHHRLYREEDVVAYKNGKHSKRGYTKVSSLALQAHALSRSAMRRIDEMQEIIGLKIDYLPQDETFVVDLYFEAIAAITETANVEADTLLDWANKIYAIDEDFLRTSAEFTGSTEPWRPYFNLAERYVTCVHKERLQASNPLRTAYQRLLLARNNLRLVMYTYEHVKRGKADKTFFPELDELVLPYTQL